LRDKNKNLKIIQGKAKDSLYLKLAGNFDGSSVHELFNTLLENGAGYYHIFIDTNELKTIHFKNCFQLLELVVSFQSQVPNATAFPLIFSKNNLKANGEWHFL
jgi:hypothetical protein